MPPHSPKPKNKPTTTTDPTAPPRTRLGRFSGRDVPYNPFVPAPAHNLAIETSTRQGALTLGVDDTALESVTLPAQRRHHVGLMPAVDALCREHHVAPEQLSELYLSLGPGSFTGLRVAVAAAKMLSLAHHTKIIGVPTLDAVAHNAPNEHDHVAVALNLKRGTIYCALYQRVGENLQQTLPPELRTIEQLLREAPRPLALLSQMPLDLPDTTDVTTLPPEAAQPRSETVWTLGRALAAKNQYADPLTLEPLYVRRPEAVELWEQHQHT